MPDNDVTLGELNRRTAENAKDIREVRRETIGRAEYESDQEGIAERFANSNLVHADLKAQATANDARITAVDEKHTAENKEILKKQEQYEKDQQGQRSQRITTILGWVASPIVGAILANLFRGSPG